MQSKKKLHYTKQNKFLIFNLRQIIFSAPLFQSYYVNKKKKSILSQ